MPSTIGSATLELEISAIWPARLPITFGSSSSPIRNM